MAFKSKASASIGLVGAPTTISDTVAAGASHTVIGLSLSSVGSAPVTASVKVLKSGGTSAFLVKDAIIPLGGALIAVGGDQKVVIEAGDSIQAYSSNSASVDAFLSYLV